MKPTAKPKLRTLNAHLSIILGAAFFILLIVEALFPFLHFVESAPGHGLLLLLCLSAMGSGAGLIHSTHRHKHHLRTEERE